MVKEVALKLRSFVFFIFFVFFTKGCDIFLFNLILIFKVVMEVLDQIKPLFCLFFLVCNLFCCSDVSSSI